MLGGLARWLRAAGYDASWHGGIDDGDVFEFALVRDGMVPALFVPRGLTVQEQMSHVLRRLGLPLREPRCMACFWHGTHWGRIVKRLRDAVS